MDGDAAVVVDGDGVETLDVGEADDVPSVLG
jgi:hypothetical protein